MLIELYFLSTVLALMPLPMAFQGTTRKEFFPNIPEHLTNTTFPINLYVTTAFDMVLVKCPNRGHKHTTEDDFFSENGNIDTSLFEYDGKLVVNWVPLFNNSPQQTKINCGRVIIKQTNISFKPYDWIFNVTWKNAEMNKDTIKKKESSTSVPNLHDSCEGESKEDIKVFTKEKNGNLAMVENFSKLNNPFVNQMFYYFGKVNNTEEIKYPCGIIQIFAGPPKIVLQNFEPEFDETTKIYTIETEDTKKKVAVRLRLEDDSSFYRDEKITFTRMRYVEKGLTVYDNSSRTITSSFDIKGFDIVNLTYKYTDEIAWKYITETFYFGPSADNSKLEETVIYAKDETTVRPNCTFYWKNIGYLKEIIYNNMTTNKTDWGSTDEKNTKFFRKNNLIVLKDENEYTKTLGCIYQTLGGNFTMIKKFIAGTKSFFTDEEGNRISTIDITHPNSTIIESFNEMKRQLKELQKSWHQKLKEKFGEKNTKMIFFGIILFTIVIILIPLVFLCIRILTPYHRMMKHKKKHPNVYEFWNMITSEDFRIYCKNISHKKYLSDKILNNRNVKRVEGDELIDISTNDLFNETLIRCYRNLPDKIKTHYVYLDSRKRKYILTDGTTKNTKDIKASFWQMIHDEDIGTVIAIIYDRKTGENNNFFSNIYWTMRKEKYGDISVTFVNKIKSNALSVLGYKFTVQKGSDPPKTLELFHICNWKENDIPNSDLQFVNIYEDIIKNAQNKSILIHSSQGTGSRVYMLTYFVCIYDAMISDNEINNPLEVIKNIREQRYGGNIGKYEFAYVIKALVSTFFNNNILIDSSKRRVDFNSNYDNFFYEFLGRQSKMDDSIKDFLNYVNILDAGKIRGYKNEFYSIGRIKDEKELIKCCTYFYIALNSAPPIRVRYKDIQCLDSTLVTVQEQIKTEVDSFIHANKFEYITNFNKTRKLILCQAPLDSTLDDMMDMIFKYKVFVVVILAQPEEVSQGKWNIYFPQNLSMIRTKHYVVTETDHRDFDRDNVAESSFLLEHIDSRVKFKFNILHYRGWPDKGIPANHKDIYELCKRINGFGYDDYTAIHCSAGIGRSGALALALYLIDTVNMFQTFDPLARLETLRQHRYLAVQKYNQFILALLVLYERYKVEIEMMNPKAYNKFYKIAKEIFKEEENINKEKTRKKMISEQ